MTDLRASIKGTAEVVLTNHRVIRNGSFWACEFCPASWPFGQPMPESTGPCVPRPWRGEP